MNRDLGEMARPGAPAIASETHATLKKSQAEADLFLLNSLAGTAPGAKEGPLG
jgi:hypothetical protein